MRKSRHPHRQISFDFLDEEVSLSSEKDGKSSPNLDFPGQTPSSSGKNPDSSNIPKPQTDAYVQTNLNLQNWGNITQLSSCPSMMERDLVVEEILASGSILLSPGGHFTYRVLGACCRLFDREELPWPCCRIQWRGKEPSWRRIGKRFVPDLATKQFPSYAVEILDHDYANTPVIVTLYWMPLSVSARSWWYRRYVPSDHE